MATQLRAVVDNTSPLNDAANTLSYARLCIATAFPKAEAIDFAFGEKAGEERLTVTVKVSKREDRDAILFAIQHGVPKGIKFSNIIPGVETGARRRLTITAEIA